MMTITLIYIIIFMNPGTGVRVLWHDHICHIVAMFVIYSHLRKPLLSSLPQESDAWLARKCLIISKLFLSALEHRSDNLS